MVGHPVAHSLSPVMHRAAYVELGLDWTYDAVDVEPGGLADHVASLDPAWRALSVTAPHKRDALALADDVSTVAAEVGAANTLLLDEGRVVADNTDVPGAVAALRERGITSLDRVRVLGAGATAASVAFAATALDARTLELVVRDPARADETAAAARDAGLDVEVHPLDDVPDGRVDLLVSTVPESAVGGDVDRLLAGADAVFDVLYDPWPTRLAEAAAQAGLPVATGLDLLAHQAVLQVRLMTGHDVPVDVLRQVALDAL